jgi:hypothetical protein
MGNITTDYIAVNRVGMQPYQGTQESNQLRGKRKRRGKPSRAYHEYFYNCITCANAFRAQDTPKSESGTLSITEPEKFSLPPEI